VFCGGVVESENLGVAGFSDTRWKFIRTLCVCVCDATGHYC
jgi:hypothetical protein